jgi:hypothetical protein
MLLTAVGGMCFPSRSSGEDNASSDGPRVRVSRAHAKSIVGSLVAVGDTGLTIKTPNGESVAVGRDAVSRFEVSARRSRKGKGAWMGALVGLAAGTAVGFAAGDDCGSVPTGDDLVSRLERNLCFSRGEVAAVLGVTGLALGTVVGAVAAPGERWEVTKPEQVKVSVTPLRRRGEVGVSFAVRF